MSRDSSRRRPGRPTSRRGERTETIWSRPSPGTRQPSHTRQSIARAAIEIADAEGFEALSMRRVAAQLRAGTMTLYHYVATKDELLALVHDAIMAELVIDEGELPHGWRDGMREIAQRTCAAFVDHPWIADAPRPAHGGPNGTLHAEQSLAVMARTGLPATECLELTALVDDYVFGYVRRYNAMRATVGNDAAKAVREHRESFVERIAELDPETFPHLHALFTDGDPANQAAQFVERVVDPRRFERGLEILLDGIEQRVEREQAAPKRRRRSR
jgi:AcrR family transcriptional regulator